MAPATTELSNGQLFGGRARLPLPDKFDGKMEHWEDWSWQVKAYVSLFIAEALRVLENAEVATAQITDDALERLEANETELVDIELVKFSRQLHYLLTQVKALDWLFEEMLKWTGLNHGAHSLEDFHYQELH